MQAELAMLDDWSIRSRLKDFGPILRPSLCNTRAGVEKGEWATWMAFQVETDMAIVRMKTFGGKAMEKTQAEMKKRAEIGRCLQSLVTVTCCTDAFRACPQPVALGILWGRMRTNVYPAARTASPR